MNKFNFVLHQIASCILLLATLGLTSGCGKSQELELGQFAPYAAQFEALSVQNGSAVKIENLKIVMGDLPAESVSKESGLCEITEGETPVITIDRASWASLDEQGKQALIFHELGHCVLRRTHLTELRGNGSPVSLMNPTLLNEFDYAHDKNHYHSELFSKANEF